MPTAHAGGPADPRAAAAPSSWLAVRGFALWLALGFVALAVAVGLLIPQLISPDILAEDALVEDSTLWAYGLAMVCVVLLRWPGMPRRDMAAAGLLVLAMAAREADLHKAMFGISILKSRFYLDASSAWPVLAALAVLVPVVVAGLWLVTRHGQRWLQAPRHWSAPMVSVTVLVLAMVLAKIMDRTPATLDEMQLLQHTPQALVYVMLSLEEILEFALPLFIAVALLQCRLLGHQSPGAKT